MTSTTRRRSPGMVLRIWKSSLQTTRPLLADTVPPQSPFSIMVLLISRLLIHQSKSNIIGIMSTYVENDIKGCKRENQPCSTGRKDNNFINLSHFLDKVVYPRQFNEYAYPVVITKHHIIYSDIMLSRH